MDVNAIQNFNPAKILRDTAAREALSNAAPQPRRTEPPNMELVLKELQQVSQAFNRRLSFSINPKIDQVVVKVIDSETDTVIKEIPPAELQNVHEKIREVIGILFDVRA